MLEEYLSSLPHGTLHLFFDDYIPTKGLYSPRQTVAKILSEHFQPAAIIERFHALPELEKNVLLGIYLYGPKPITAPEARRFAPGKKADSVDRGLHSLQTAFFIAARDAVPVSYELFPEIASCLAPVILEERVRTWSKRQKSPAFSPFMAIWNDLSMLLTFAAKERLGLTQKGFLTKRSLDDLNAAMQIKENFSAVLAESTFRVEQLPERFRLIYTYAHERELVQVEEESLRLTGRGLAWLGWGFRDRLNDFLAFAAAKWTYPREESRRLFALLSLLREWTDAGWLLAAHKDYDRDWDHESPEPPARPKARKRFEDLPFFIRILCYAGELHAGWDRSGKPYLISVSEERKSPLEESGSEPEATIRITPDFGLIIPGETNVWARFRWLRFGSQIRFDQVYHARVSRASVHEALENGIPPQEIRDLVAAQTVSPNVLQTLDGWMSEFGRISFANPFVLVLQNQGMMDELKKIPAIAHFLRNEIPGYGFVVDRNNYGRLFASLQQAGYFPRSFQEQTGQLGATLWQPESAEKALGKRYAEIPSPEGDFEPPALERNGRVFRPGGHYGSAPKERAQAETVRFLKFAALAKQSVVLEYAGDETNPPNPSMNLIPIKVDDRNHRVELSAVEEKSGKTVRLLVEGIRRAGKGRE